MCLDVINQKWSPMFGETSQALRSSHAIRAGDWAIVAPRLGTCLSQRSFPHPADLINVFEVFLPQLLLYPNPTDPLNGEAAAMLMREPEAYKKKVQGEPPPSPSPPPSHWSPSPSLALCLAVPKSTDTMPC